MRLSKNSHFVKTFAGITNCWYRRYRTLTLVCLCFTVLGGPESRGVLRKISEMLEVILKRMDSLSKLGNTSDTHRLEELSSALDRYSFGSLWLMELTLRDSFGLCRWLIQDGDSETPIHTSNGIF